ncbi:MAG: ATP-binding protein [Nitrospira sp.]|nr:ATP-binding protein [Nitrospira sp.]
MKSFPGQRSVRKHPIYALEMALIADGVPMDKLYPIDVDRAFKKLEELKPHVLVVDEVGYLAYGDDAANVLYHVVNDRHIRRRAMISRASPSSP